MQDSYKVQFELFDGDNLIGAAALRFKKLHRGEEMVEWVSLEPVGKLHVTLQALTFGKISTLYFVRFSLIRSVKPVANQPASFFSLATIKKALPLSTS